MVSSIHSFFYTCLYIFNVEHVEGLQGNNMKEFGMSRQWFTSRFRHLSLILASDWPLISFSFAALSFFNFAIFAFQRFSSRETVCSLSQNAQKTVQPNANPIGERWMNGIWQCIIYNNNADFSLWAMYCHFAD